MSDPVDPVKTGYKNDVPIIQFCLFQTALFKSFEDKINCHISLH